MHLERQKDRIKALRDAEKSNKKYLRRVRIQEYLAGQAIYNLGDYPERVSARVTDYDRELISRLAKDGVTLIQLHEEWNDAVRAHGADKFSAVDKEGMLEFIDLCHQHGIKVIAYISTGYFHEFDPDFKEEYTRNTDRCKANYFCYRKCNLGNPDWRDFIIGKAIKVLDEYGFDGLFNDWGYDNFDWSLGDCVLPEGAYDPDLEDALSIIYYEIKKRGGICKLHCDRHNKPPVRDRVYDYLWIGEGVAASQVGAGKDYMPYVVPCLDLRHTPGTSPEDFFAYTIPFLQFPLLKTGRPIMGNNTQVPGVEYFGGDEYDFYCEVGEYMKDHPNGPYVTSLWSDIPDLSDEYEQWAKYFALYKPMVEENSLAYIELTECDDIVSELPENVFASMFVNADRYLVVSNVSGKPYTLKLSDKWKNRVTGEVSDTFTIENKRIAFLIKE